MQNALRGSARPPDPQGPACIKPSAALPSCLQPLALFPRGWAPTSPTCRSSRAAGAAWQVIDSSLPAAGKTLHWGNHLLYPPPVLVFLQGWSISPGRAWCWKVPKCPGRGELPMPCAQHGRAPGAGTQPGTQRAAWQGENHAGCSRRSQAPGSQPPSAFSFFQQHQSPPLHPPGLQIGSTLLQMASQLKPSFFPPPAGKPGPCSFPSQKQALGQNSTRAERLRGKGHTSPSPPG